jgi:hypothetical protein
MRDWRNGADYQPVEEGYTDCGFRGVTQHKMDAMWRTENTPPSVGTSNNRRIDSGQSTIQMMQKLLWLVQDVKKLETH